MTIHIEKEGMKLRCGLALVLIGLSSATRFIEGEFEVVIEDHGSECEEYGVVIDPTTGDSTRLDPSTIEDLDFHAGDMVRLEVEEDDPTITSNLHVLSGNVTGHAVAKQARIRRRGAQRLLIVLANYLNGQAVFAGCGETCIRDFTWRGQFSVDSLYRQSSYGLISLPENQGRITTVNLNLQMAQHTPNGRNDLGRVRADVTAALRAQRNIVPTDFDFLAIYSPALIGIGVAFLHGRDSFMNSRFPDTLAHELGHNFGKGHAGRDMANNLRPTEEYGDRSSTMGFSHESLRPFSMPHQLHTNWVPVPQVAAITDSCRGQVFTLHAAGALPPNPTFRLAVTIPRDAQNTYVISLRTAIGHDTLLRAEYLNVVSIHYINIAGVSNLVALVRPGTSYTDPANGYIFTVGQRNGNTVPLTLCSAARQIRAPVSQSGAVLNFGAASAQEEQNEGPSNNRSRDTAIAVVVTLLVVGAVAAAAFVVVRRRKVRALSNYRVALSSSAQI